MVFAGLSALVIEAVEDEDDLIRVVARTRDEPVPCPVCGALTGRVHSYGRRTVTDVPVDGRPAGARLSAVLAVPMSVAECRASLGCWRARSLPAAVSASPISSPRFSSPRFSPPRCGRSPRSMTRSMCGIC
ncbi:transposase family protein [Nonomuraea sp. NPDC047897]|uniref:transposase family protein n=1 Tax=Nonomuraea sp. NPDC047897 TaxID=3364346 RepID=UPI00371CE9E9